MGRDNMSEKVDVLIKSSKNKNLYDIEFLTDKTNQLKEDILKKHEHEIIKENKFRVFKYSYKYITKLFELYELKFEHIKE